MMTLLQKYKNLHDIVGIILKVLLSSIAAKFEVFFPHKKLPAHLSYTGSIHFIIFFHYIGIFSSLHS